VATSSDDGKTALFILNRDLTKAQTVEVNWEGKAPGSVLTSTTLTGSDLKAFNTFDNPNRVAPQPFDKPRTANGRTKLEVPARSYTVIQWGA
jgi:alpha-N-arabinofuranosidase